MLPADRSAEAFKISTDDMLEAYDDASRYLIQYIAFLKTPRLSWLRIYQQTV